MQSLRTRFLLFMIVSIIYVLLVFMLHRHLINFNVPDTTEDANEVEVVHWTVEDQLESLAFPVVRRCVGEAIGPPSGFLPLGRDWLYTAYLDDRLALNPVSDHGDVYIRVLALLRRRDRKPTFYFRWPQSKPGNASEAVSAEAYEMCENHGRRYGGWILSTKFTGRVVPCYVIVTLDLAPANAQARIPLFRMSTESKIEEGNSFWLAGVSLLRELTKDRRHVDTVPLDGNFAVCVPPLYGAVLPATLVQFIELTRLLGAEHFIFYVSGVSAPARRVLEAYETENLVTTIPWVLPSTTAKAVWYNGQLLAANDCLYRTSHAFQYVAFNDVDEFIVPHSTTNWSLMLDELMTNADRRRRKTATTELQQLTARSSVTVSRSGSTSVSQKSNNNHICGYTFRSAFFQSVPFSFHKHRSRMSAYSNSSTVFDKPSSYDVSSVHRSAFSRVRSKVIVRPSAVFELGIHHISRPLFSLPAASTHTTQHGRMPTDVVASTQTQRGRVPTATQTQNGRVPRDVVAVDPDVGFVHHYRECTNDYEYDLDCNVGAFVVDDRLAIVGYTAELRQRVRTRLQDIRDRKLAATVDRPTTAV